MNRNLKLLSFSLLLWGLGEGLFYYIQPLYLDHLGATPVVIGVILGAGGFASAAVHIPAGWLADRVGRKPLLIGSWLTGTAAAAVMFLSNSLAGFTSGVVLYSTSIFVMAPLSGYITTSPGGWTASRRLTTVFAAFSLGLVIGPFLGGLIADLASFRSVYGVATILFCVSTLIVFRVDPQEVEPRNRRAFHEAKTILRRIGGTLVFSFTVYFALYFAWPFVPVYLEKQFNVSLAQIGLFGSINALGVVFLNLVLGRLPIPLAVATSQISVATSSLLLWSGAGVPAYAAAYFLAGGNRTIRSLLTACVAEDVERSQLGLAFGMLETVLGLVLLAAPLCAGLLYSRNPSLIFPASLMLILFTILAVAYRLRRSKGAI
jgi:MFS family permease